MPFLTLQTNVHLGHAQELRLKDALGRAIELVPGKSEANLLLQIQGGCHFYLRGDASQPVVLAHLSVFANEAHTGYDRLTMEITRLCSEILCAPPENIYVKYEDLGAWGVAGQFVDRRYYS